MATVTRIGNDATNFWDYDTDNDLIDLSRASSSNNLITLQTSTSTLCLNPEKTALLIVDMQNFFLSPAVRPRSVKQEPTAAEAAAQALLDMGIPAARAHGIQIVWLSWGLTECDLNTMPPAVMRTFGNYTAASSTVKQGDLEKPIPTVPNMIRTKNPALYRGLGTELGTVDLGDNQTVQGGRVLMRGSWNAGLYEPLERAYQAGSQQTSTLQGSKSDVLIYKNRTSGLCIPGSDLEKFLEREGITTLLFGGVNTDQCVGGTLMDAFSKGYDCILLRDAATTGTPFGANEVWEWNITNCWGFVTTCEALQNASTAADNRNRF
ncbi:hypothetical protein N7462_003273 [Penicillium macrosclerotiorum]|uniref:uncharacterized protein n=1 Tax=Penicillium macrosclerotiorum TaxID=303699 RepID=UPI002548D5B3|nr:uncharacterized protein N7462_003273 [Penicillium macrosclerotiorum]KAJ5688881.1 hypothetical protein N7462_003273 [Penicillium macrosclerotiorum]